MIPIVKEIVRYVRGTALPLQRLRLANPNARLTRGVLFDGRVEDATLKDRVHVAGPSVLSVSNGGGLEGARLEIGARTYVGEFNNIRCAGAPIVIGPDCLVSQQCTLVGSNHGVRAGQLVRDQPWHGDGIVIGSDVWIGAGATILPGARIGDGAVIASRSVVRGEVPALAIMAGAPARQVGTRTNTN